MTEEIKNHDLPSLATPMVKLEKKPARTPDGKVALKPFVQPMPLAEINTVFDAVHHRTIKKRAVMVP